MANAIKKPATKVATEGTKKKLPVKTQATSEAPKAPKKAPAPVVDLAEEKKKKAPSAVAPEKAKEEVKKAPPKPKAPPKAEVKKAPVVEEEEVVLEDIISTPKFTYTRQVFADEKELAEFEQENHGNVFIFAVEAFYGGDRPTRGVLMMVTKNYAHFADVTDSKHEKFESVMSIPTKDIVGERRFIEAPEGKVPFGIYLREPK